MRRSSAGQADLAAARCATLQRLFGDRLYMELQRHGTPAERADRSRADRARLCQRHSARRHQRAVLRQARGLRRPRRADLPSPKAASSPRPTAASSPPSIISRAAPRWPRCSPICRRRSPRRSRSRSAARSGRAPKSRSCRASRSATARSTRAPSCARAPRPGSSAASQSHGLAPGRTHRGIPRAARLRAEGHRGDEISRLLPDRLRLHPMGEGAGHSGRAGPRLGRGLARLLCADHHRPRSAALRPAVRALPQSRARVDAGLRHRLLPGPPRRGDPLRAGALRPRSGGADHHLRHLAGARRAARRRPRAGNALRPGRQALQARAAEPGGAGDARQGDRGRAASCRPSATAIRSSSAPSTSRSSSKASTATPRRTPPAS